jgi:hypothetical protein
VDGSHQNSGNPIGCLWNSVLFQPHYSQRPYIQYCYLFILTSITPFSKIRPIFANLTIRNCIKSKVLDYIRKISGVSSLHHPFIPPPFTGACIFGWYCRYFICFPKRTIIWRISKITPISPYFIMIQALNGPGFPAPCHIRTCDITENGCVSQPRSFDSAQESKLFRNL